MNRSTTHLGTRTGQAETGWGMNGHLRINLAHVSRLCPTMSPLSFIAHLLERRGSTIPGFTITRALATFVILSGTISLLYSFYQTVGDWASHRNLLEGLRLFRAESMGDSLPPLFLDYYEAEERLPQHNLSLPFPEGRNARLLRFGNQMWGVGLNNQFQEVWVKFIFMTMLLTLLGTQSFELVYCSISRPCIRVPAICLGSLHSRPLCQDRP